MMESTDIYLLRHGDTGRGERYIGATDAPLSSLGRQQIIDTAGILNRVHFDRVFCSPLRRCMETCTLLELSNSCMVDERLREINFGSWEELTFAEIVAANGPLVDQWQHSPQTFRFPKGESLAEFQARVRDFHGVLRSWEHKNILVIAHGGVIRHLICLLLGLTLDNYLLFPAAAGSFASVRLFSAGGVLTGFNIHG